MTRTALLAILGLALSAWTVDLTRPVTPEPEEPEAVWAAAERAPALQPLTEASQVPAAMARWQRDAVAVDGLRFLDGDGAWRTGIAFDGRVIIVCGEAAALVEPDGAIIVVDREVASVRQPIGGEATRAALAIRRIVAEEPPVGDLSRLDWSTAKIEKTPTGWQIRFLTSSSPDRKSGHLLRLDAAGQPQQLLGWGSRTIRCGTRGCGSIGTPPEPPPGPG